MKRYSSQHDTLKTEINIKMETVDMSGCIVRVELLPVENVFIRSQRKLVMMNNRVRCWHGKRMTDFHT